VLAVSSCVEPIPVGRQLGPYRIEALLGAGGMGVVYLAHDSRLLRRVAIKMLDRSRGDARDGHALLQEARVAAALNHPSICGVHEVGHLDGEPFIVMEHINGVPLGAAIPREVGFPLEVTLNYAIQIVAAVAHAHRHGVVHGDLTSANIMIDSNDRVKVLDFGLAVRCAAEGESTRGQTERSRRVSGPCGTVPYMAPELLRGQIADARSDVWALGVILFEMAGGRRPFRGATSYEMAAAILTGRRGQLAAGVSHRVRQVVTRCLAARRDDRFASGCELAAALRELP
jgi:eukaryotic-like serine/threonine-protein kinase